MNTWRQRLRKVMVGVGITLGVGMFYGNNVYSIESFTTTLSFYQGCDVNTGMTVYDPRVLILTIGETTGLERAPQSHAWTFDFAPQFDFYLEFTGAAELPAVLIASPDVSLAVFDRTPFATFDEQGFSQIPPNPPTSGIALTADTTIVMRTADGSYIVFGEFVYHPVTWTVQLTYRKLTPVPEASTLILFGVGLVVLRAIRKR